MVWIMKEKIQFLYSALWKVDEDWWYFCLLLAIKGILKGFLKVDHRPSLWVGAMVIK